MQGEAVWGKGADKGKGKKLTGKKEEMMVVEGSIIFCVRLCGV